MKSLIIQLIPLLPICVIVGCSSTGETTQSQVSSYVSSQMGKPEYQVYVVPSGMLEEKQDKASSRPGAGDEAYSEIRTPERVGAYWRSRRELSGGAVSEATYVYRVESEPRWNLTGSLQDDLRGEYARKIEPYEVDAVVGALGQTVMNNTEAIGSVATSVADLQEIILDLRLSLIEEAHGRRRDNDAVESVGDDLSSEAEVEEAGASGGLEKE